MTNPTTPPTTETETPTSPGPIAYTWVKDYRQMAEDMAHSFHHFHPDVPLHIFNWDDCKRMMAKYDCTYHFLYAAFGRELAETHPLVIHIDADILVTAHLTRVFEEQYDVAGVRALPDQGLPDGSRYRRMNRLSGENLTVAGELNAGFFAVRGTAFWDAWIASNRKYGAKMRLEEQDTLNDLFYSSRYRALLLDPVEEGELWGTATKWGKALGHGNEMGFLESWRGLRLHKYQKNPFLMGSEEKRLMLKTEAPWGSGEDRAWKRVHMLHTAGGDWKDKHLGFDAPVVVEKFDPSVREYLGALRGRRFAC
jgi:hypothetical protein